MSIYEKLIDDHELIKELMDKISDTTSDNLDEREDFFKLFKNNLLAHAKAEEKTFYDMIDQNEEIHFQVLESKEEHAVAQSLIKQLEKMSLEDETWMPKFKVLMEIVEHHIKEEESVMFPMAKKALKENQADELESQMDEQEQALMLTF